MADRFPVTPSGPAKVELSFYLVSEPELEPSYYLSEAGAQARYYSKVSSMSAKRRPGVAENLGTVTIIRPFNHNFYFTGISIRGL